MKNGIQYVHLVDCVQTLPHPQPSTDKKRRSVIGNSAQERAKKIINCDCSSLLAHIEPIIRDNKVGSAQCAGA